MSNNFKNSAFAKSLRENKSVWITAVTLLVALAVITTVAVVTNRAKKEAPETTQTPPETTQTPSDNNDNKPPVPNTPDAADVVEKLPSFDLPVAGKLIKAHDSELQVFSGTMNDYRIHLGLDISTETGTEVKAAADGTVKEVWEDPMMGNCIAVTHGGDSVTIYKNLAAEYPEGIVAGAKVQAGQTIAFVGESAMTEIADEPHLHFEMTVGGLAVDPLEYFGESAVASLGTDQNFEKDLSE